MFILMFTYWKSEVDYI